MRPITPAHSKDTTSSGSVPAPAKTAKKFRVALQNPCFRCFIDAEGPFSLLKCSSQQDAVCTRKHIEVILHHSQVVHFSLRKKHGQLSLYGGQFLIVEERSRTQPGAIEDDWLGELLELRHTIKMSDHDRASGYAVIGQHRIQVDRRLNQHRVVLQHKVVARKGMLRLGQDARLRYKRAERA